MAERQDKENPPDPEAVKAGDILLFPYYAKVENVSRPTQTVSCVNLDTGAGFEVRGDVLVLTSLSADQAHETVKVSKTQAAELLSTAFGCPFTVCFVKDEGSEERTLRGRLVKPETVLGRSLCEDLDLPKDKGRFRLVDHRTIKWLVLRGVKYVVGK